ncbi:MAG: alpha/beta hydrolase [Bacteroidales bacterium]|jgi:pimeloyl-ACP methyl ester carboxylesterase|nr:alpha/beta hydrolase [Bacteroidales bacterium]
MIHKILYYNGNAINYQCEGQGEETIVMLHGFMFDLRVWAPLVYDYMRKIRVVAIDLPGFGESDCCDDTHSMELMADVTKAVLDEIGIKKCVLTGHSMGGYAALAFAEKYPQMLKGLCLLNSHALADGEEKIQSRKRMCDIVAANRAGFIVNFIPNLFAKCNREILDDRIKDLQEYALYNKTKGIIAAINGMIERKAMVDMLSNLGIPVLFVAGREDERIDVDIVLAHAAITPFSELLLLPNVGHMAHIEAKDLLKMRLLAFVHSCFAL